TGGHVNGLWGTHDGRMHERSRHYRHDAACRELLDFGCAFLCWRCVGGATFVSTVGREALMAHMTQSSTVGKATNNARSTSGEQSKKSVHEWPWVEGSTRTLALALVSGSVFGFLLQKGGVAKYDILVGALLLTNFVVFKVMLTAIAVGMVGVYLLQRRGVLKTQISETAYVSNIVGSLIFGL